MATENRTKGLSAYLRSAKALWYWSTIIVSIIASTVIISIPENLYPWIYMRNIFGLVAILWLPGYVFTRTFFLSNARLKHSTENLSQTELFAWSFVMSLAMTTITGFVLNYTPWGLGIAPTALSLLILTIVFGSVGAVRDNNALNKITESSKT